MDSANIAVGQGFDAHRFCDGRPLILGGVEVPCDRGLAGHSDADVLTHAICDALLGALGAGDLGEHFPDDDPAHLGACSLDLLARVVELAAERGAEILNVDATAIAQEPKLGPYKRAMAETLGRVLGARVNVKATTTEGLGFAGRGEGIAALAVAVVRFDSGSRDGTQQAKE